MERIFTRDMGTKFAKGDKRDYPRTTWDQIARNARMPLEQFTKPAGETEEPLRRRA